MILSKSVALSLTNHRFYGERELLRRAPAWGEAPKRRLWRMKRGAEVKKQGAMRSAPSKQCDYVSEGESPLLRQAKTDTFRCLFFAFMGVYKKEKYKIVHRIDKTPNLCYNNA